MKTNCRIPKYRLHKPSKQAVVTLSSETIYLGAFDSPESKAAYDREVREWIDRGRQPRRKSKEALSVAELIVAYWAYVEGYYVREGKPSPEQACIKAALRPVGRLYGRQRAADFGPRALTVCREALVDGGQSRYTVNKNVGRIKRMFAWATEQELIPGTVYYALLAVKGLKRGRTKAKESPGRQTVADEHVEAVMPFLSAPVAAMIRLQLLTGMRPGEVVQMRPCDIDRSDDVWVYTVPRHKTDYLGFERRVPIGPQAQDVLTPFLARNDEAFCFSPKEAEAARNARRKLQRRSKRTPSQRRRKRKASPKRPPRESYTRDSYRRAIQRACDTAEIPRWHPHQLRHNAATRIEEEVGFEEASLVLGHRQLAVTEVYVHRKFSRAVEVAARMG